MTYTNCTFPNGVCNNQYGKTVFNNCQFTNSANYNLWNYGGETPKVEELRLHRRHAASRRTTRARWQNRAVYGEDRRIPPSAGLTEKAAIVASKAADMSR